MAKRAGTGLDVLTKRLRAIRAKDIMTEYVITTTENTTLAEVAALMIKTRVSGFPVVGKKGKIVGVITSTDLFIVMDMIKLGDVVQNGVSGIRKPTVKFAMSTDVVRIKKSTTLDKIIALMKYRNLHTLPVMEGNQMVGVIGRRDVFKNFYAAEKDLCL